MGKGVERFRELGEGNGEKWRVRMTGGGEMAG